MVLLMAEKILIKICRYYGITFSQLLSKSRRENLCLPRQVAMYVLWQTQTLSLKEIGGLLGGRSAATISHGYQKIAGLLAYGYADRNMKGIINSILNNS